MHKEYKEEMMERQEAGEENNLTGYYNQFLPLAYDEELDSYLARSRQLVVKTTLEELVKQVAQQVVCVAFEGISEETITVQLDEHEHEKKTSNIIKNTCQLDNVVVTSDPQNFIQVTEIGPRESHFRMSNQSAKSLLILLDKEILPLYKCFEEEKDSDKEMQEILFQKEIEAGRKRHYQLLLAVFASKAVLNITEVYYSINQGKDFITKISIPGHFIHSFRQKLSKKMAELEPYFKRQQANKSGIDDFLDIVLINQFQKIGIKISKKGSLENGVFMSLPVIYRSLFYLKYYDELYSQYFSTSTATETAPSHFVEEDDRRYDFTFSCSSNGKYILGIQQTIEGQDSKSTIQIGAELIKHLILKMECAQRDSDGCVTCAKVGHFWKDCPKEEHSTINSSVVFRGKYHNCKTLGHTKLMFPCKQGGHQPLPTHSSIDCGKCSRRSRKTSESASCLSYNSSEQEYEKNGGQKGDQFQESYKRFSYAAKNPNQNTSTAPKERKIVVHPVYIDQQFVVEVVELDTKCSEFWMTLKVAKDCIDLITSAFIPAYNQIENKEAVAYKGTIILVTRSIQSAFRKSTYSLEFGLNRFHYFLRIISKFTSSKGNALVRTVMMRALRMQDFCVQLKEAIAKAETLQPNQSVALKPSTSELDKDDGFSEPVVESWTSINPSTNKSASAAPTNHPKYTSLIPMDQLRWFNREKHPIHYIAIEKSANEIFYLSIPVAVKCDECLHDLEKRITFSNGLHTTNAPSIKHWIAEKDCRYDLELIFNNSKSFFSFSETYTGQGKTLVVSFCINANQVWLLRIELKKRVTQLKLCGECGKARHQGRDCISTIVDCSLFDKQDKPINQISAISPVLVNGRSELESKERIRQTFEVPQNFFGTVQNFNIANNPVLHRLNGVKVSVIRRRSTEFLLAIQELNDQEAENTLLMSARTAEQVLDRLKTTILPSFQSLSIKNTSGLANPLYDQRLDKLSAKSTYKLVYGFDEKKFFLIIRQYYYLSMMDREVVRQITIPDVYLPRFCEVLIEKIQAAKKKTPSDITVLEFKEKASSSRPIESILEDCWTPRQTVQNDQHPERQFSAIAPVKSNNIHGFDRDKEVSIKWKEDCCFVKVTNIRATKSYLWLCMRDIHKFVFMLKQFDNDYQALDNKDTKSERNKHLCVRKLEGVNSHYQMRFGVNSVGYYLRTEQTSAEGVARSIVVSGYAIHCFIDLLNTTLVDSGACFKCGLKGHAAKNCRTNTTCFQCGSLLHFKAFCPALAAGSNSNFVPIKN